VQVYAAPFPMDAISCNVTSSTTSAANVMSAIQENDNDNRVTHNSEGMRLRSRTLPRTDSNSNSNSNTNTNSPSMRRTSTNRNGMTMIDSYNGGIALRRIRHAEVVLVDQISIHYGRFWLRLRFPGPSGGFGGYIALGTVGANDVINHSAVLSSSFPTEVERTGNDTEDDAATIIHSNTSATRQELTIGSNSKRVRFISNETIALPQSEHERERENPPTSDTSFTTDTYGYNAPSKNAILCRETNLYFPSSSAMKLLPMYDDGLQDLKYSRIEEEDGDTDDDGEVVETNISGEEPVFCRICREGIHDVDFDTGSPSHASSAPPPLPPTTTDANLNIIDDNPLNNAVAGDNDNDDVFRGNHRGSMDEANSADMDDSDRADDSGDAHDVVTTGKLSTAPETTQCTFVKPPTGQFLAHLKKISSTHPSVENPLLSPCECSGSMAFVHYLCIEQWRCRSRHPAARLGSNCETCGGAYTLPPPPQRRDVMNGEGRNLMQEDEWLEAMPAHVLAALRRPHLWWQIGAAVVRRKYLRPFAPILVSPIVALYCRARRTLKKRGVSRRRWACSLCRRRARWKCVRCLRSYYCSRQCQNVSWHIVHKHVCYKPARFWWSAVVYTALTVSLFPGVWTKPLVYAAGAGVVPACFFVMGVLGGSFASVMKKGVKIDMRGRCLELSVVVGTLAMAHISWGVIRGFFGTPSECTGIISPLPLENSSTKVRLVCNLLRRFLFNPIASVLRLIDKTVLRAGFASSWFCQENLPIVKKDAKDGHEGNPYMPKWTQPKNIIEPGNDPLLSTEDTYCFRSVSDVNPNFLHLEGGENCVSDVKLLAPIWLAAYAALWLGMILKKTDRRGARAGGRRENNAVGGERPHED